MPNSAIYLSDENFLLLREVDNKSGLINQLLKDYFSQFKTPSQELKLIEKKEEMINLEAIKLKDQSERIRIQLEKEKEVKRLIEKKKYDEEKPFKEVEEKKKWDLMVLHQKESFKNITGRSFTPSEEDEYFSLLREGLIKNILEYMIEKNIPKKELNSS